MVGTRNRTTYASVLSGPGQMEMREFQLPAITDETGLLRVEMAGICSGTDVKLYRGKLDNPFPIIMGHEIVGVVEEIGAILAEANEVEPGDRVILRGARCGHCRACAEGNSRFCAYNVSYGVGRSAEFEHGLWGGYAQHVFLAKGAVLEKVPEGVTFEQALMAGVLANGFHWCQTLGGVKIGTSLVVQGVGQQGLAAVMAGKFAGAYPVIAVGLSRDRGRLERAKSFGADLAVCADGEDVIEAVKKATGDAMADVVVEVTGAAGSFIRALDIVRPGGTIVHGGLSGAGLDVPVPLDKIVWKQIRVQGVFSKPPEAVSRVLSLLRTGRLPIDEIISHRFSISQASQALELVEQGGETLKVVLTPEVD